MGKNKRVKIAPILTVEDQEWLRDIWPNAWGGEIIVSKGRKYHFQDLESAIAWTDGVRVGAATYRLCTNECELISINTTVEGGGIGTTLISAVEQTVRQAGIHRIWLITSNDNLDALRFYQRRGYRITAVYLNAIDEARKIKKHNPYSRRLRYSDS